jgi:hypothetical protein
MMSSSRSANDSLARDLHGLLSSLTNEPPSLKILSEAAAAAASDRKRTYSDDDQEEEKSPDQLRLLERHVARYEDLLDNALSQIRPIVNDEIYCDVTSQFEDIERNEHPINRLIKGPRPDLCVWVGLFLGRAKEQQARDQVARNEENEEPRYENVLQCIEQDAKHLPVLQLLRNSLQYLREESARLNNNKLQMLRFCALYGLSGAMKNVLDNKYGANGQQQPVTIDTAIPVEEDGASIDDERFSFGGQLFLPAYAFAAACGYRNVVRYAISEAGANIHAPQYLRTQHNPQQLRELPELASDTLLWAIKSNKPDMVKCLAGELGLQFRWISSHHWEELFYMLFHIEGMGDEFGVWRAPNYDPERYWDSNRSQRKYRAHCCFKQKQTMLKAMIKAGLPQELFLPQLDLEKHKTAVAEAKAQGKDELPDSFWQSLSKAENRATSAILQANAEFNDYRKRGKKVTYIDFYENHAQALWKDQPTVQATRLSEREEYDPRWKKAEEKGEEEAFAPWWAQKSEYDYDY